MEQAFDLRKGQEHASTVRAITKKCSYTEHQAGTSAGPGSDAQSQTPSSSLALGHD